MTSPLISPQSQRLNATALAIANSSGVATFSFAPPPNGFTFTGTLNCASAPSTALFTAAMVASGDAASAGVPWGNWGGNSVYGPVQAWPPESLVVTATGLSAGVQYVMSWLGSVDPLGAAAAISPAANSSALAAVQIAGGGVDFLGTGTLTMVLNTGWYHATVGPFTAGHSYSTVVFVVFTRPVAPAAGFTMNAQVLLNDIAGLGYTPGQTKSLFADPGPNATNLVYESFYLPAPVALGESFSIATASQTNPGVTFSYIVLGTTAPMATVVAPNPGSPAGMFEVGGTSLATHTFAGAGGVALLAPPGAGLAYRLQRLSTTGTANLQLTGTTSGVAYSTTTGVDNLAGLCATEGLTLNSTAATTAALFYDLIAQPTLL